ncbi:PAQR family membrane homeostasis protein TrhA [Martelella endophytica]|uniref:DNA-binding protein n=1 Tax=Martelella endophytica TaxID=1486262 RepID=A0A0D5LN53_MAREN|nr:hemolysin III family protein [Martelella endophytica]AJY45654.1 DNA-binding protein [Martelella endophytica]
MPTIKTQNQYDIPELIADGVVHGIGIVMALIGATILIFYAAVWLPAGQIASAAIYSAGLVVTLGISCSYNLWPVSLVRTKAVLKRLDHSSIFVLIAATYTPFLQRGIADPFIFGLLVGIWTIAALGIALKVFWHGRYDRLAILLYLAMGWSGVIVARPLFPLLPLATTILVVIGGIIYSAGVIFHVWEKLRFQNAIWHGFVVAAAAVHYAAVLTCLAAPGA